MLTRVVRVGRGRYIVEVRGRGGWFSVTATTLTFSDAYAYACLLGHDEPDAPDVVMNVAATMHTI